MKLCAAAVTTPIVGRVLDWAGTERLKNWAGNLEYGTDKVFTATSIEQVQESVKQNGKLKALGSRHCFNDIADSKDAFISLKPMDKVIALDPLKRTVTVGAGITYGQLCPYLDEQGFALHNLASLPHISVAGACSTATHGSGEKNGNLSTAVCALEMVKADGKVVVLSRERDGETFYAAVVGLGALGVITRVTLEVQPRFQMRQYVYEDLPFADLQDHFDAIESSGYSVSLFTNWQKQRVNEVWIKSRVEAEQEFHATAELFGAKLAPRNLHPIKELSAENCTQQMGIAGPWYERLPHFRMGFTPSAGKELQAEYFVPRKHAVESILAVERLHDQVGPALFITEIRTIAADKLWMSPCYERDCVTIHFTWKPDWPAVSKLLPIIERELAPFDACPHWGKLFTTSPSELKRLHKKMPQFVELCKRLDPQGKFRNQFLNQNIFS